MNRRTVHILVTILAIASLAPMLPSCGKGETVAVSTTFISSTLATRSDFTTTGCGTGFLSCITPTTVTGKAYYAGMIVGTTNGISLGPMIGTVENPAAATAFSESELLEVDLGQQIKNTGSPSLSGPIPYPADTEAYLREFHIYFGWIDVTFTIVSGEGGSHVNAAGTHTLRQVMADITGTEMKKGDIMYKASGDTAFKWCSTGAGCAHTTRPATPILNSDIANYTNTDAGNKTIPSFFMSAPDGSPQVQITKGDLTSATSTNLFTVDVTLTLGAKFLNNGSAWTTLDVMANDFRLAATPGSSTSGFTAVVTYTK